jgi:hypothetical protein
MFMKGGGFFLFFLAQHTHAAMHMSRPKARTPISTPATMAATGCDPLLLLPPLFPRPLLSYSPPPRFADGGDGDCLDGAAGEALSAAGAGGGNDALPFCGAAVVGGDSDGTGGDGDCDGVGGEGGGEPVPGDLGGGPDGLEGGSDDDVLLGGDGDREESPEFAVRPSMLSSGAAMIINVLTRMEFSPGEDDHPTLERVGRVELDWNGGAGAPPPRRRRRAR